MGAHVVEVDPLALSLMYGLKEAIGRNLINCLI